MSAPYGWIIDRDLLAEQESDAERAKPGTNSNAVGMAGPRNVSDRVLALLRVGQGRPFRMLDDDGEVYYLGRILGNDLDGEQGFAPLEDFGTPNAGAVTIEYQRPGQCKHCVSTSTAHEQLIWVAL